MAHEAPNHQDSIPNHRLTTWKEIAAFVGREVRTVQRWEKDLGLPVHRVPGSRGHQVYAYAAELQSWLKSGVRDSEFGVGAEAIDNPQSAAGPQGLVRHREAEQFTIIQNSEFRTQKVPGLLGWARSRAAWPAAGLLLVTVWAIAMFKLLAGRDSRLAKLGFSGRALVAWNAGGKLLWTHDFGRPLRNVPSSEERQMIQLVDLAGDGRQEVLVMAPLLVEEQPNSSSDALYCFSSRGKVMWRHTFDETVRFGGRGYGPPWELSPPFVTAHESKPSLWCVARSLWWSPSVLVELDSEGHELARFVNWGHLHVLNRLQDPSGSYILAGGINNECNCAALAVLKEDEPSGSSPSVAGSGFACENCPEGKPYRYLLFPRSELNSLSGVAYNQVIMIDTKEAPARVWVQEAPSASGGIPGPYYQTYELAADFVPQSVEVSDHYWELHRQMEREGKLNHTVENCPERLQPRTVRMSDQQGGWRSVQVPPPVAPAAAEE
jgi:hypothetical protein